MFIKSKAGKRGGWTLIEMMIGVAIFGIAGLALATIFSFSIRSFAALTNYSMLDLENRVAMDKLTSEIREAKAVLGYSTNAGANSLTILNGQTQMVTYTFSGSTKKMLRVTDSGSQVLLTNCDLLNFSLFMRPPTNATFDVYVPATNYWSNTVKLVQLTWKTSTTLPTAQVQSENVQTARVIIRKQQDDN
jgi:prepilin-type N-terminal cleavage/methylation domain-containing protein